MDSSQPILILLRATFFVPMLSSCKGHETAVCLPCHDNGCRHLDELPEEDNIHYSLRRFYRLSMAQKFDGSILLRSGEDVYKQILRENARARFRQQNDDVNSSSRSHGNQKSCRLCFLLLPSVELSHVAVVLRRNEEAGVYGASFLDRHCPCDLRVRNNTCGVVWRLWSSFFVFRGGLLGG